RNLLGLPAHRIFRARRDGAARWGGLERLGCRRLHPRFFGTRPGARLCRRLGGTRRGLARRTERISRLQEERIMVLTGLPLMADNALPQALRAQVARLEALGADTTFHRYMAHAEHVA